MRYHARITRLQRLLLNRAALPPFVVHLTSDGTTITKTITIHMRFE